MPYFSIPIAEPMAVFFARAFGAVMTGLGPGGYAFLDQKAAATNKVRVQVREREGLGLTTPVATLAAVLFHGPADGRADRHEYDIYRLEPGSQGG